MKKDIIPITSIFLDVQNPRLKKELDQQNTAIVEFFLDPNNKVSALTKDIAEYGIDPSQRAIVIPVDEDEETYIVLEGNRRVCALKILSTPEILVGNVSESRQRTINKLAEQFRRNPIDELDCVVMDNRNAADKWLQLRHTGQNLGVGVVEWDAEAKGRYLVRLKQGKTIALQVLDIVDAHGLLSEMAQKSEKKIYDAIRRIVTDADAQQALGYQIINNKLHTYYPAEEVAKGLTKIVEDFKSGAKNTNNIHSKTDRKRYLKEFAASEKPNPATKKKELRELDSGKIVTGAQPPTTPRARRQGAQTDRVSLVPSDFKISIPHHRLSIIYLELRKLRFEANVNAIGVLFRAFLDMSLDEFVDNNTIVVKAKRGAPSLTEKINAVADHLQNLPTGAWTPAKLRAIRKFASTSHGQGSNVDTLHAWVHDRNFSPTPTDLRLIWNNIESFIQRLWE